MNLAALPLARARRLDPANAEIAFALGNIYFECADIELAVRACAS